jgi:hypothetical protein
VRRDAEPHERVDRLQRRRRGVAAKVDDWLVREPKERADPASSKYDYSLLLRESYERVSVGLQAANAQCVGRYCAVAKRPLDFPPRRVAQSVAALAAAFQAAMVGAVGGATAQAGAA